MTASSDAGIRSQPDGTSFRNDRKKNRHAIDLVFRDLKVDLASTEILHDVSGIVQRGQMLAVMGPSGAGKSTLLNALAGRLPLRSGDITLNGQPLNKQLRRKICYVLQNDVFFSNLTLRQTLTFTALLRLPEKMEYSDKMQRVEEIVNILDLRKCIDTVMGNAFRPGLSGGEKKRANIACELLTNPSLMLIDEPTSGLDSAIAYNMMQILKHYTQRFNKTVVASIHQPSSAIFHMFDLILLLSDGHVAYFGQAAQTLDFFSRIGLTCLPHYNPADFMLEKVRESKRTSDRIIAMAYKCRFTSRWPPALRSAKWPLDREQDSLMAEIFANKGMEEKNGHIPKPDSETQWEPVTGDLSSDSDPDSDLQKWPTGFVSQYWTLTRRNLVQARHRMLSRLNIIQTICMGLIAGMLWFRLPRTEETLSDRFGLMFFCVTHWGFFTVFDIMGSFPEERPIIKKERPSGSYRISAYYCAKMTSEIPLLLVQPSCFFAITYWMCNMNNNPLTFLASVSCLLLNSLAAQSVGLFMAMIIPNVPMGVTAGTVFNLCSMLAAGFFTRHVPSYFMWLNYGSYLMYSFNMLITLELHSGVPLLCLPPHQTAFPECIPQNGLLNETLYVSGDAILKTRDLQLDTWLNVSVLVGIVFLFRFAGYLVLRFYDPMKCEAPKTRKSWTSTISGEEDSSRDVSGYFQQPAVVLEDEEFSSVAQKEEILESRRDETFERQRPFRIQMSDEIKENTHM